MNIPDYLYHTIYLIIMGCIALMQGLKYQALQTNAIIHREVDRHANIYAPILVIFFIIFFGLRDPYSECFSDTIGYTRRYNEILSQGENTIWFQLVKGSSEKIWSNLLIYMAMAKFEVWVWYTVVASVYILGIYYCVKTFFPNNIIIGLSFAFLNFGFYLGAVNGIRNAMGLSLILISLALICKYPKKFILALIWGIIAIQIHKSCLLPLICLFASRYIIRKPQYAMYIWILALILSLSIGSSISGVFEGLGVDDRLDEYLGDGDSLPGNPKAKTGFRWDFLLFSIVPIIFGLFIIVNRKIKDWRYDLIFNTYVLANSFWILVIRANYSNRFAALSWFLYFLLICYPLLKHNIFKHQGQLIAGALIYLLAIAIIL